MKYSNVYGITRDLAETNPAVQDSILSIDVENGILTWVKGDGEQRMVVASYFPITFKPLDGITYSGVLRKGTKVIYRGRGDQTSVDGLDFTKDLYFYIFAFNGVQSTEKYNRETSMLYVPADSIEGEDWQWYSGLDVQWESGAMVELE